MPEPLPAIEGLITRGLTLLPLIIGQMPKNSLKMTFLAQIATFEPILVEKMSFFYIRVPLVIFGWCFSPAPLAPNPILSKSMN
jgi:hypothetical protein